MSRKITKKIRREVLRLRKVENLSANKIAARLGISRNAVSDILEFGLQDRPITLRAAKKKIGICPICRCRVILPCLACETPRRPHPEWAHLSGEITYDLTPSQEKRRLEVKRRAREANSPVPDEPGDPDEPGEPQKLLSLFERHVVG